MDGIGFVIERQAKVKEYLCIRGEGEGAAVVWSVDVNSALRFARATDAAAFRGTIADDCRAVGINSPAADLVRMAIDASMDTGSHERFGQLMMLLACEVGLLPADNALVVGARAALAQPVEASILDQPGVMAQVATEAIANALTDNGGDNVVAVIGGGTGAQVAALLNSHDFDTVALEPSEPAPGITLTPLDAARAA